MPGAGIKAGSMTAESGVRVLDVTRLVSRIGRGPLTGIDRVELAYLRALPARGPLLLLLRTAYGYLVLPTEAGARIEAWLREPSGLPRASLADRLRRRLGHLARAEAGLRPLAIARCAPWRLGRMLRRVARAGVYLNVGHADLEALARIKAGCDLATVVMLHDTIPLDHPDFSRAGEPARFRARLAMVAAFADRVICPSQAVMADVARWCGTMGRVPKVSAAPLGVTLCEPDKGEIPADIDLSRPWFVILGTIEPRKNHALLLDAWEIMARVDPGREPPQLLVLGSRGWADPDLFARLDRAGPAVREVSGLSDGAVAALIAGARGLLMPSLAEGFGLPVAEAMGRGVPVLAADLPVYREFAGEYPVYLNPGDAYSWAREIRALAAGDERRKEQDLPDWDAHLNIVLNPTC